ncbi:MAG: hypothetical protein JSU72_13675 [Deltaproteobacteria bacterium]|nr:MAG: hypothetical protein JSU72_13675 [Deltaproteobacteria bacterium]
MNSKRYAMGIGSTVKGGPFLNLAVDPERSAKASFCESCWSVHVREVKSVSLDEIGQFIDATEAHLTLRTKLSYGRLMRDS